MFDLHTLPISPHTHIKDQGALPDTKRFQIVELPHGLLIEEKLLDNVEEKLTYTFTKRKRSSKNGRIYLLTHILEYEDGSSYYGGCAKGLQYFYYYSKGSGPNIRCEEIEKIVIDRIKAYFKGNEIFSRLVEDAVKKRINELPKIDHEISRIQKELHDLEDENRTLRDQLKDKEQRSRSGFMNWLEEEVEKLQSQKNQKEQDLANLLYARADLMEKSGLEKLEKTATEFIAKFDELTGVQKRSFIERMIAKIVIKQDNKLELHVLWDPKQKKSPERFQPGDYCVTRTTTSSISEPSGGPSLSEPVLSRQSLQPIVTVDLPGKLLLSSERFLRENYIEKGLSATQIAEQIFSSKSGVLDALRRFDIPIREPHVPHGRVSQPRFGQKKLKGKLQQHLKESSTIEVIHQLRSEGLTLRRIAEVLSKMGIPTKCRSRKWHPEMIRRILRGKTS